jgi:glutamyl-tRNA synthetase
MKKDIEKLALQNAVKFKGKANPGAIIGHLFRQNPELKKQAKEVSKNIAEIVREVNALSVDEQKERLEKIAPELLLKKPKKKRTLPELQNVTGPVVTRIPPEPSKYPHIGHALSFLINFMYAQKYEGKCVLRLDDTNPEKAKKEYYQAVYDTLLWLRITPDKTMIASNEMETFYKYAQQLIDQGNAYVCFDDREKMSHQRQNSMLSDDRQQNPRQATEHWEKMKSGEYEEGKCILRLKGDMDSLNAVMRDPVLFRISHKEHPLQKRKYNAWPMYDFETAVAEDLCGITHILRSNEFGAMRIELQNYIKDLLGLKKQEVKEYGRFNIVGAITQGREIRAMIENKEVEGWDDPRLVTILALQRRGIVPQALYDLVLDAGLSPTKTNLDWTKVAAANRKIIDKTSKRFFFVKHPQTVEIEHHLTEVEVPNHPENEELGKRKISLTNKFYVQDDIDNTKAYRFMHILNFIHKKFISAEYDSGLKAQIIHAVPYDDAIDVQVLMSDGSILEGKGEKALQTLKVGEVVQFERLFFCRLDNKEKMLFVYAHD